MCEVSGNRGILILIRQLPTGPSNRPPAGRCFIPPAAARASVAPRPPPAALRQTRRAARGVENLI